MISLKKILKAIAYLLISTSGIWAVEGSFSLFSQVVQHSAYQKLEIQINGKAPMIAGVCYIAQKEILVSACENLICVWSAQNLARQSRFYDTSYGKITALVCDKKGEFAYVSTGAPKKFGKVLKINLEDGKCEVLIESKDEFLSIAISEDSKILAAGSADGMIFICDIKEQKTIISQKQCDAKIVSLAFNNSGDILACAQSDGKIISRTDEDNFETESTSYAVRGVPICVDFMPRSKNSTVVATGFGYASRISVTQRFLERTTFEMPINSISPAAIIVRNFGFPIIIAGKSGALISTNTNFRDPLTTNYESVHSRLEALCQAPLSGLFAGGGNGEIFLWQNYEGLLVGGIVLQDAMGKDYALWTRSGRAFSTLENSIKFVKANGETLSSETSAPIYGLDKVAQAIEAKTVREKPVQNQNKIKIQENKKSEQREKSEAKRQEKIKAKK